jgi:hypothetical protein
VQLAVGARLEIGDEVSCASEEAAVRQISAAKDVGACSTSASDRKDSTPQ